MQRENLPVFDYDTTINEMTSHGFQVDSGFRTQRVARLRTMRSAMYPQRRASRSIASVGSVTTLEGECAMKCRERLESYLRQQQVVFEVQEHHTAFTAQEVAETEHIPGKLVAKTVVMWADGRLILLVLPASFQVDLTRLNAIIGAKATRLAHETEFADTFPDCEIGAMPPFGNLYDLPVYVDKSLTEDETIVFPAGTHTETISLRYADYERLVKPTIGEFTRRRATSAS